MLTVQQMDAVLRKLYVNLQKLNYNESSQLTDHLERKKLNVYNESSQLSDHLER